jgi:uncharacterized protein DUF6894
MPRFDLSLEDDMSVWTRAELECPDEDTACACAVQLVSTLFVRMQEDAPDWSSCRIRIAGADGQEIFDSSAAQAALVERDRFCTEAIIRTDH